MPESLSMSGVYAISIGNDFATTFVSGLLQRYEAAPPETLAKVEVFVNSERMRRRVHEAFLAKGALLLPQIHLITQLSQRPDAPIRLPAPVTGLRRRLRLATLVKALLQQEPDLAPQSAVFDFTASLAGLLDEMQGEGVPFEKLEKITVGELSGHWERSLRFLTILSEHWTPDEITDPQDRQRATALALAAQWAQTPPDHPVIVAGSTGSRGASALFMRAVARLPQGAVVLPGFDREMPEAAWQNFGDPRVSMDHPQAMLFRFCQSLDLEITALPDWVQSPPKTAARNRLVSLALRPAPFTDQWLTEGPDLVESLPAATAKISMLEADNPKEEARAIAVRLRKAVRDGQHALLISPDRDLTRRVTATLTRWHILPDDSAGRPLHQSPPGVFLRLVANCFGQHLTPLTLVSLLKHPLAARGDTDGNYRLFARDLERRELRGGAPFVDFNRLQEWAAKSDRPEQILWVAWLRQILEPSQNHKTARLSDWIDTHKDTAEALAAGPDNAGSGILWEKETGNKALAAFDALKQESDAIGDLQAFEYAALFLQVMKEGDVREATTPHPLVSIMGPREAREQGADLVILGGLNEGIWPKPEAPDPWLNRSMRQQVGLPPPERQIGLSAHDFQQAISAPEVVLSRALRDGEAPTVASRWLLRLTNLLGGLGPDGETALQEMQQRGNGWVALAQTLDVPADPQPRAPRPSPCPPLAARPKRLSVTQIKTLIRDPYAIYARKVLNLHPMDPLGKEPDALSRGIALHEIVEQFIGQTLDGLPDDAARQFLEIAADVLKTKAPWPAARRFWLARLSRIADWFITTEKERRVRGRVLAQECSGERQMPELDFLLSCKADRLDIDPAGNLWIYDYKSGRVPSERQTETFDKQLQLEAAIAQAGGFDKLGKMRTVGLEYIGLGASANATVGQIRPVAIDDEVTNAVWAELHLLISAYHNPEQGYSARSRMFKDSDFSDYDHLSRRGEWQDNDTPEPERVG